MQEQPVTSVSVDQILQEMNQAFNSDPTKLTADEKRRLDKLGQAQMEESRLINLVSTLDQQLQQAKQDRLLARSRVSTLIEVTVEEYYTRTHLGTAGAVVPVNTLKSVPELVEKTDAK